MIVDLISNLNQYTQLGDRLQKAFEFIIETDLLSLNNGKYDIEGEDVYAVISQYNTRDQIDGKFEAHKKYIDVQLVLNGREVIGYAPFKGQEIVSDYIEEKDVILFIGEKSFFKIEKGMFAIFFPGELHMPGIKFSISEDVKKVVIKVRA
jgi:YhcH/YjgK/YiaL family protein